MDNDDSRLTLEQLKALFAEWTEDYAAAKERDRKAVFRAILCGTDIVSPTPKINNQKDREGGIER
jgi:hypothetical protein